MKQNGLLGDKLTIMQPEKGYRSGIDPVFLAAFAKLEKGSVLDLGCGVGTAFLCLKKRYPDCDITGIEIQESLADLASDNAQDNGIPAHIITGDLREKTLLPPQSFDQIIINPPYFEDGTYFEDGKTRKQISNHEGGSGANLVDWLTTANRTLKPKGFIIMIHRIERLDEILSFFKNKNYGGVELFPLWAKTSKPAKLILIRTQKDSQKPLTLHGGLVIHDEKGDYTKEAQAILFDGEGVKT